MTDSDSDSTYANESRTYTTILSGMDEIILDEIDFLMVDNPVYDDVAKRLATFDLWNRQIKQTPDDLSDNGFYYTGFSDRVRWEREREREMFVIFYLFIDSSSCFFQMLFMFG